jgi:lactococcin 972 family bacteriocin
MFARVGQLAERVSTTAEAAAFSFSATQIDHECTLSVHMYWIRDDSRSIKVRVRLDLHFSSWLACCDHYVCSGSVGVHTHSPEAELRMKLKRALKIAAVSGALVVASAAPAMATIAYVGGGTWDYGAGSATVWSDYHHSTKCHGSTSVGTYIDSDEASAGYWSITSAPVAWSGNESYYRTTC